MRLAAKRVVKHFETKFNLFGPDRIGKDITLEDLDEHDMESLTSGGVQPLPGKDRGGRAIFFSRHEAWKYKHPKNMVGRDRFILFYFFARISVFLKTETTPCVLTSLLFAIAFLQLRAQWYVTMSLLEDIETQQQGIVVLAYNPYLHSI